MATTGHEILSWTAEFVQLVESGRRGAFAHAYLIEADSAEGAAFYGRALARAINCAGPASPASPAEPTPPPAPAAKPARRRSKAQAQAPAVPAGPACPPCGTCEPCSRARAGSYPPLVEVWPHGLAITIAQVQQVIEQSTTRYGGGVSKVFVLHAADRMQVPAANALLKTLEEPPARTVFVLATSSRDRVLPTIRSRCRAVRLALPDDATIAGKLGLSGPVASRLATGLAVAGRQPEALVDLVERLRDVESWTPPGTLADLAAPVKKALKAADGSPEAITPAHVLLAGGWYSLTLAAALAAEVEALAARPTPMAALTLSARLARLQELVVGEADKATASRIKGLKEQYGGSLVDPRLGEEGKITLSVGRAHAAVLLRAWQQVLRLALHRLAGNVEPAEALAGREGALASLAAAGHGGLARMASHTEEMRAYVFQNVAVPLALDELVLGCADVIAGRGLARARSAAEIPAVEGA